MTLRSFVLLALATLAVGASAGAAAVGRHVMARDAAGQRAKVAARTRPRSLDGMRQLDVAHQDEQNYDAGFDTCSAFDRAVAGAPARPREVGRTIRDRRRIRRALPGRPPARGPGSCFDALTGRDERLTPRSLMYVRYAPALWPHRPAPYRRGTSSLPPRVVSASPSPRLAVHAALLAAVIALVMAAAPPARAADPTIAAAGDIACDPLSSSFHGGAGTATACHAPLVAGLITATT